ERTRGRPRAALLLPLACTVHLLHRGGDGSELPRLGGRCPYGRGEPEAFPPHRRAGDGGRRCFAAGPRWETLEKNLTIDPRFLKNFFHRFIVHGMRGMTTRAARGRSRRMDRD